MREGTDVYLWLIHVDVWQKQYNIVITLQLKINKKFLKLHRKKITILIVKNLPALPKPLT